MLEFTEVVVLFWFGLGVAAWGRRIPPQNLVFGGLVIGVGFVLIRLIAGQVVPSSRVGWRAGTGGALIAVSSILLARLSAAWLFQRKRQSHFYGWILNGLAAVLAAIPLLAELGLKTDFLALTYAEGFFATTWVVVGVFALLLITLPFWLDKRQPDLQRQAPLPVWPLLGWLALSFWVWWRRTHFSWLG